MGFMEEIKTERKDTRARAEGLRDSVLERAREAVDEGGVCRPTVAAFTHGGSNLEHFFPAWENDQEKAEVFHHLNKILEDEGATATVCLVHGHFTSECLDDPEEVRTAPDALPAVICITQTLGWKEMRVQPYRRDDEKVEWLPEVVDNRFETNMIRVPRGM